MSGQRINAVVNDRVFIHELPNNAWKIKAMSIIEI